MKEEWASRVEDETRNLKEKWQPRDNRFLADRRLRDLIPPTEIKGVEQITLNEPKIVWETSVTLLSLYTPRFRIPLTTNIPDEEKAKINKVERFLTGVFREIDRNFQEQGNSNWFRSLAYWVCGGWYAVFPLVVKEDGETKFYCDLYDPITVYPEWDSKGLRKLARAYTTFGSEARSIIEDFGMEVTKPIGDKESIEVINYWERTYDGIYNCVLVGGEPIKPWTKEDFPYIPIFVGTVGGSPERAYAQGDVKYVANMGESILSSNKDMYEKMNRFLSFMMQISASSAYPPQMDFSQEGMETIPPEKFAPGVIIPRKLGEPIQPIPLVTTPIDANAILSLMGNQIQKGGLPYSVYGTLPFELSGFALSQLLAAVHRRLGTQLNAYNYIISRCCVEFIRQFRASGGKIDLLVEGRQGRKGELFIEEFKKDDIPKIRYIEVDTPLVISKDKSQQIIMAKQALAPPAVLSRETLWDEFLDVQDSDLEWKRIIDDMMLELPIVQQINIVEELREKARSAVATGKNVTAQVYLKYADMIEKQIQMAIMPKPAQPSTPGIAPGTMPPEMGAQGGPSSDEMAAILGQGPSGLSRRPQTPEERAQSKRGV